MTSADLFRRYRETAPVHWHEPSQAWLITRYEDIDALLRDARLASRTVDHTTFKIPEVSLEDQRRLFDFYSSWVSLADNGRHTRLRQTIVAVLSPSKVTPWHPALMEIARRQMRAADWDDIEGSFACPYVAQGIGTVLGLRSDELAEALASTDALVGLLGGLPVSSGKAMAAVKAIDTLTAMAHRILDRPMSAERPAPLICAQSAPRDMAAAVLAQLIAGGYSPLVQCIVGAARRSLEGTLHLSDREEVLAVISMYSPFELLPRVATEPVEIRGQRIAAGDRVLLAIGSANHDESSFHRLGTSYRPSAKNLSFGSGRHRCPGVSLAAAIVSPALSLAIEAHESRSCPN